MKAMTVEDVKAELPDVQVRDRNGEIHFCRVAGRYNPYATVYQPQTGSQWEVAWGTVARCVTKGIPIQL